MVVGHPQVALASEDVDYADPQTALWFIARTRSYTLDAANEARQAVAAAVSEATEQAEALSNLSIANWTSIVQANVGKAAAAGVDVSFCGQSDLNTYIGLAQVSAFI